MVRRISVAVVAVVLGVGLTGCSSGASKAVSKDDLAQQVKTQLAASVGQTPKSVTCADNLPAKVGSTVRCTLTAEDGTKFGVTVNATDVKGDDVRFHIKVDDHAMN